MSSFSLSPKFMTYSRKKGMVPLRSERFGERVTFAGNLDKNDLSFTLSDVQLEDEGVYNCYVKNPPDRIKGHGVIQLNVVTKRESLTLPPVIFYNWPRPQRHTFSFSEHTVASPKTGFYICAGNKHQISIVAPKNKEEAGEKSSFYGPFE